MGRMVKFVQKYIDNYFDLNKLNFSREGKSDESGEIPTNISILKYSLIEPLNASHCQASKLEANTNHFKDNVLLLVCQMSLLQIVL